MMIIPYSQLSAQALQGIIEEYVSREGTDYGEYDVSLDEKCQQVLAQLRSKEAVIVYSDADESLDIVLARQFGSQTDG